MSRVGSSAAARRGGELVDVGGWDDYTAAPTAYPPARSGRAPPPHAAASSASSIHRAAASSRSAAPASHHPPAAAFTAGGINHSGADRWLRQEPVTVAVDQTSDRPLYCLAVNERTRTFVVGGADHSLRVYDLSSGALRRELYSKNSGHTEWVTSCAYLPDGRVLSGGMDSKVCLWDSTGGRGIDLLGHTASVSKVMVDAREVGISAGYDRTVRVWALGARASQRELGVLKGMGGAVTAVDWHNSLVVAGTREGQVGLFDLTTQQRLRLLTPAANGQILALQLGSLDAGVGASDDAARMNPAVRDPAGHEWILAAGGADGFLRLYDLRASSACIFQRRLSEGQPGSVNDVSWAPHQLLVSLADGVVKVLDARGGFRTVAALTGHRGPVQTARIAPGTEGAVAVSAGSNGWLCVHDLRGCEYDGVDDAPAMHMRAAYAMGLTTAGGINAMWLGEDRVVAAGDDGQPVILQY